MAVQWCRTKCDLKVCSQLFYPGAGDSIISEVTENQAPKFSLQNRKLILFMWCLSTTPALAVDVSITFPKPESQILNTTSCTPTQPNLYLANSLATVVSETGLHMLLTFHVPNLEASFHYLSCTKQSIKARGTCICFVTRPVFMVRSC